MEGAHERIMHDDYHNQPSEFLVRILRCLEAALDDCERHDDMSAQQDRPRFLSKKKRITRILLGRGLDARRIEERMMARPTCKVFLCGEAGFDYRESGDAEHLFYCERHAEELGLSALGQWSIEEPGTTAEALQQKHRSRLDGPEVVPAARFVPKPNPTPPTTPTTPATPTTPRPPGETDAPLRAPRVPCESAVALARTPPRHALHRLPREDHGVAGPTSGRSGAGGVQPVRPPHGDGAGMELPRPDAPRGVAFHVPPRHPQDPRAAEKNLPRATPVGVKEKPSQKSNVPLFRDWPKAPRKLKPTPQTTKGNPMPKGAVPRPVKCLDTGEIFPTARKAAESVGLHVSGLTHSISQGRKCGGKRWAWAAAGETQPKSQNDGDRLRPVAQALARPSDALVAAEAESLPSRVFSALARTLIGAGLTGLAIDDFHVAVTAGGRRTEISLQQLKFAVTEIAP